MNTRSIGWRWAVITSVALLLAHSQAIAAESLRPAVDTGGSGGGSTVDHHSDGTLDETLRAINLAESTASASTADQPAPYHYRDATHVPESLQGAANAARQAEAGFAVNANLRSILLIEGKEAPNVVVQPPDFAVNQNLRSIQLIEGKEAAIEIAQPAASNGFSICLSCSSLG